MPFPHWLAIGARSPLWCSPRARIANRSTRTSKINGFVNSGDRQHRLAHGDSNAPPLHDAQFSGGNQMMPSAVSHASIGATFNGLGMLVPFNSPFTAACRFDGFGERFAHLCFG